MTLPPGNPMERVLQVFLLLYIVVFGLVIPGMIQVSNHSLGLSVGAGGVAIVIAAAAAGTLRRGTIGYALGWLTQVVGIGLGFLTPYQFVTGGVFALLWVVTFVLGKKLAARTAAP